MIRIQYSPFKENGREAVIGITKLIAEREEEKLAAATQYSPDFRFECAGANLLILSDAFIHAGSDARNQARRIYTPWVKNKTGRFSYVSTDS